MPASRDRLGPDRPEAGAAMADLRELSSRFLIPGRFLEGGGYGTGHINETCAVSFDQGGAPRRYILQRQEDDFMRAVRDLA